MTTDTTAPAEALAPDTGLDVSRLVETVAEQHDRTYRLAAYVIALERIVRAVRLRGYV